MSCQPMREGCTTCDGWDRNEDGMFPCQHYHTPTCPMPSSVREQALRNEVYLREVGFGSRYLDTVDELFVGAPDTQEVRDCAAGLRQYWEGISANMHHGVGFMLFGGVGTGKTRALALTALKARSPYTNVRYVFAPTLFAMLHNQSDGLRKFEQCDLLLLDDLGAEYANTWNMAGFIALSEYRYANRLATCITSNMAPDDLGKVPGFERPVDRWRETCGEYMFQLGFGSLRGEQSWQQSARVC